MKHHVSLKSLSKSVMIAAAFVVSATGASLIATPQSADAASSGIKIINNCGRTKTYGIADYSSSPGTGGYYKLGSGKTAKRYLSPDMYRISLPKGIHNSLVYGGHYNTVRMC